MSILKYTLIRLALFAGFAGLFYLAGMRSYMLVLAAIICAAMANYIFFRPATVEAAKSIERLTERSHRSAGRASAEDAGLEDADAIEDPAGGEAVTGDTPPGTGR